MKRIMDCKQLAVIALLSVVTFWMLATQGLFGSIPHAGPEWRMVMQELQEAVSQSEARLSALAGRSAAAKDAAASTDVSKLLEALPAERSQERERLHKMQYCDRLRKVDMADAQLLQPWIPSEGKYLLPLCRYGQISNRLDCLRHTALLAALLNRTLIVPDEEGRSGSAYSLVLDVSHARRCIGDAANRTVVSLDEYKAAISRQGKSLKQVVVQRLVSIKGKGFQDMREYQALWGSQSSVKLPEVVEVVGPLIRSAQDLVQVLGKVQESVISVGDLFQINRFPDLPEQIYLLPNLPLRSLSCRLWMQPHPAIVQAAKGFVNSVLGPGFLAIHLRRGDFHAHWDDKACRNQVDGACRLRSIQTLAFCIKEKMAGNNNSSVIFAATNASPFELRLLQALLPPPLALILPPTSFKEQPWDWARPWILHGLDKFPLAFATFDKMVCAMSSIFMGTFRSTFTQDIITMRAALGTLSCADHHLCAPFHYDSHPFPTFVGA